MPANNRSAQSNAMMASKSVSTGHHAQIWPVATANTSVQASCADRSRQNHSKSNTGRSDYNETASPTVLGGPCEDQKLLPTYVRTSGLSYQPPPIQKPSVIVKGSHDHSSDEVGDQKALREMLTRGDPAWKHGNRPNFASIDFAALKAHDFLVI